MYWMGGNLPRNSVDTDIGNVRLTLFLEVQNLKFFNIGKGQSRSSLHEKRAISKLTSAFIEHQSISLEMVH